MKKSTFNAMLRFHPDQLMDLFGGRFVVEKGLSKAEEIVKKVNGSQKLEKYIFSVGFNSTSPTHTGIITNLTTVPYFIFCKGETLCLGALTILLNWNQHWNTDNLILDDHEVSEIIAEIMKYSYSIVLNKSDTIFNRFFDEIDNIAQLEL